jgi:ABC-type dipeptide/oligopeptide/nickel transport system ATPase subunit
MIIGVSGYSGSGKDTIGTIIQYLKCPSVGNNSIEEVCKNYQEHEEWLVDNSEWEIRKFAGKLKDIASHLTGIDI